MNARPNGERSLSGFGVANRSIALSVAMLFLLLVGVLAIGAKVSAPFIYTLF